MTRSLWRMTSPSNAGDPATRERFARPEAGMSSYAPGEAPSELLAAAVDGACPACGTPVPRMRRVQPLSVVWPDGEPPEDERGDFVWPVGTQLPVVSHGVGSELRERFGGFELGPVAEDPASVELWVAASCRPHERSTLRELRPPCPSCGVSVLVFGGGLTVDGPRNRQGTVVLEGVEWFELGYWNPATKDLDRIRHPREPGRGLFVAADELGDADVFFVAGDDKAIVCTEDVKTFVEGRGWTDVAFLEAGEIV